MVTHRSTCPHAVAETVNTAAVANASEHLPNLPNMSELNIAHNRAVWFDIPVADLDRAADFYAAVLNISVTKEQFGDISFGVLEHDKGNGGCLVIKPEEVAADKGLLIYMNTDGRIQDAVSKVTEKGGSVIEPIHSIGPHGFRALVLDSEGNRIALHSETDQ